MEERSGVAILLAEKSFINATTNSIFVIVAFGFAIGGNDLKLFFSYEKSVLINA